MSDYEQFLHERDQIDFFIQKGYKIKSVTENLSGAIIGFEKMEKGGKESIKESLHIVTPHGRKYFSVKLIQQNKVLEHDEIPKSIQQVKQISPYDDL